MDILKITCSDDGRVQTDLNGSFVRITLAVFAALKSIRHALKASGNDYAFQALLIQAVNDPKSPIWEEIEKENIVKNESSIINTALLDKIKTLFRPTEEEEAQ